MLGSGKAFRIEVRKAAGAYVCGEETAMLESIEGKRGIVRAKPPLPALEGLFGQPTVINNVITLASVPIIMAKGAGFYKDFGMGRSTGTLPFQITGNVLQGGLVERAFGLSLRELLFDFGGGSRSGRPIKAVQVGGPLGAYVPESQWDVRWLDTAASWCMTTRPTWPAWPATPWNFVHLKAVANARLAALAPHAAWKPSTVSAPLPTKNNKCICCATCATPCCMAVCVPWAA